MYQTRSSYNDDDVDCLQIIAKQNCLQSFSPQVSGEEGNISDSPFWFISDSLTALEKGFLVTSMFAFINGQDENIQMKNCTFCRKPWREILSILSRSVLYTMTHVMNAQVWFQEKVCLYRKMCVLSIVRKPKLSNPTCFHFVFTGRKLVPKMYYPRVIIGPNQVPKDIISFLIPSDIPAFLILKQFMLY